MGVLYPADRSLCDDDERCRVIYGRSRVSDPPPDNHGHGDQPRRRIDRPDVSGRCGDKNRARVDRSSSQHCIGPGTVYDRAVGGQYGYDHMVVHPTDQSHVCQLELNRYHVPGGTWSGCSESAVHGDGNQLGRNTHITHNHARRGYATRTFKSGKSHSQHDGHQSVVHNHAG